MRTIKSIANLSETRQSLAHTVRHPDTPDPTPTAAPTPTPPVIVPALPAPCSSTDTVDCARIHPYSSDPCPSSEGAPKIPPGGAGYPIQEIIAPANLFILRLDPR